MALLVPLVAAPAAAQPAPGPAGVIVRWADGVDPAKAAGVLADHDLTGRAWVGEQMQVVTVPAGRRVAGLAGELTGLGTVAYAEPNVRLDTLAPVSDEPGFGMQWGLHNTGQSIQGQAGAADVDLDAPLAWSLTRGRRDVTVAVIDTGVDLDHPDLAGNLWTNVAEANGRSGVDDDGNGKVDDVHGWDFVDGDASIDAGSSSQPHGTHVAGILAAAVDGTGIVGTAPRVTIMPLRFLTGTTGTAARAIAAVNYAARMGADVINASWGSAEHSRALAEAISDAGIPVVAAAGNSGQNLDRHPVYPAAEDLPNVLSVTAVDNRGRRPSFAGYGDRTVDVGAPGVDIVAPVPGGGHAVASGTSMAVPFAAGVAAMVAGQRPGASAGQVVGAVRDSAAPLDALRGITVSGGLVNAAAALRVTDRNGRLTAPMRRGDRLTTDPLDAGAGQSVPLQASVTAPTRGEASLRLVSGPTGPDAGVPGFSMLAPRLEARWERAASAPSPAPGSPLTVTLRVDGATAPERPADLAVLRGGVHAPACRSGGASPDPCVAARRTAGDDLEVVVRTTRLGRFALGTGLRACPPAGIPDPGFDDLGSGPHVDAIACSAWWGLARGVGDGRYAPAGHVDRGTMARFLARLVRAGGASPPAGSDAFPDDDGHAHEDAINTLAAMGIVRGDASGRYRPRELVSRAQMASYLVRTYETVTGTTLPDGGDPFTDDDGTTHEAAIGKAHAAGFATGVSADRFAPGGAVTRAQMASFLTRVLERLFEEQDLSLP